MEYKKKKNLLDNTQNQPSKFRTKNWVEINDDARGMYNTNSQDKFKTSMLKSSLCNYSDAYILVSETIIVVGAGANDAARATDRNKIQGISKYCASFTDCITEINNIQVNNAQDLEVIMLMYNLIEYSDNYSKKTILQR